MGDFRVKPILSQKINIAVDAETYSLYMRLRHLRVNIPEKIRSEIARLVVEASKELDVEKREKLISSV